MKISRNELYMAFNRMQEKICDIIATNNLSFYEMSQEFKEKFIYSYVMHLYYGNKPQFINEDLAQARHRAYDFAVMLLGTLTPVQLERLFPITKEYDGKRYETKDYFTAKDALNKLPQDEPINQNTDIVELLWDYYNNILRIILVNLLGCVDDIRRLNNEPSMMEEFAKMNGITTYKKFKASNGKEYLKNEKTGEIKRVVKPLPRYIRIVK